MQLSKTPVLGLFVLCTLVCYVSAEEVPTASEVPPIESKVSSADVTEATTISATRVPEQSTSLPPLHHAASTEASAAPVKPEAVTNEQKLPEKGVSEPPKENGNNTATSISQVYPLAIASLAVLLFSAI